MPEFALAEVDNVRDPAVFGVDFHQEPTAAPGVPFNELRQHPRTGFVPGGNAAADGL